MTCFVGWRVMVGGLVGARACGSRSSCRPPAAIPPICVAVFFAGGQAFALAAAGSNSRPGLARWWLRAKAVVQAGLLAAAAPRVAFAGRAALTDYSYSWAGVLGKLSFGELYALYRTPSGGKPKPRQA